MDLLQRHFIRNRKTILDENDSYEFFTFCYRGRVWSATILDDSVTLFYRNKQGLWAYKHLEFKHCAKFSTNDWIRTWNKLSTTTHTKICNKKRNNKNRKSKITKRGNNYRNINCVSNNHATRCSKSNFGSFTFDDFV